MKYALMFLLTLISFYGFNQDSQNKFGITLQLNSPSKDDIRVGWFEVDSESVDGYSLEHRSFGGGLLFHYQVRANTTVRLRTGLTRTFIKETSDAVSTTFAKGEQLKYHFAPGIVWSITENKFTIHGGFELPVNLSAPYEYVYETQEQDASGEVIYHENQTSTLGRGYSFGAGALMGFSYRVSDAVSVGAEFASALLYANLGGRIKATAIDYVSGNRWTSDVEGDSEEGFIFGDRRFSIGVTYHF
jgi:hypothetical protein